MWYEHGQSERLINLDLVRSIQMTAARDSLIVIFKNEIVLMLEFADEAEATEVYQILRTKLTHPRLR